MTEAKHSDQRERHQMFWFNACEEFIQILFAYARRLVNGREHDAEDLVQETKYRALAASTDPQKIRKTPQAYLLGIMHHVWVDKWKRENPDNMDRLDDRPSDATQPKRLQVEPFFARILESTEAKERLQPKLGPLTSRERTLLKLYWQGNKCKDIADQLGEDVRITRSDLNAVRNKVNYRLRVRGKKSERSA
jgi:RNA polymerase sigma factor (sigma-70 family)